MKKSVLCIWFIVIISCNVSCMHLATLYQQDFQDKQKRREMVEKIEVQWSEEHVQVARLKSEILKRVYGLPKEEKDRLVYLAQFKKRCSFVARDLNKEGKVVADLSNRDLAEKIVDVGVTDYLGLAFGGVVALGVIFLVICSQIFG